MLYDGWVYLAKSDTGHYKIGRSVNPFGRIKHFDTIMPIKVELIHAIPCDDSKSIEKHFHNAYAPFRVSGEWFDLPEIVVAGFTKILVYVNNDVIRVLGDDDDPINSCCFEELDKVAKEGCFTCSSGHYRLIEVTSREDARLIDEFMHQLNNDNQS